MTDPVSQIHTLSSSEAALVDKIKQILEGNAVESTPYTWGHRYGSERLKSATDELKAEISKKHTVSVQVTIRTELLTLEGSWYWSFKNRPGGENAQGYNDNRTRTVDFNNEERLGDYVEQRVICLHIRGSVAFFIER